MSIHYFNSLGGYSAGIPEKPVIDSSGNVVTNVLTEGNVTANYIYTDNLRFSNGQPYSTAAGGTTTQLQYNNNGYFAGIPTATYSNSILSLGDASAVSIGGGVDGYYLQTDGSGNLSWAAGGGAGNGNPGGSNTQIQYNDAGLFGGSTSFTFNKSTNTVNLVNLTANGKVNLGSIANVSIGGGTNGYVLTTDGAGNLIWAAGGGGGGNGTPGGSNTQLQFNDGGNFAGAATVTYDKDTSILAIYSAQIDDLNANTIDTSVITVVGNVNTSNINVNTRANVTGTLRATGNINSSGSPNIYLGTVSNVHITGGVNGYVLTTDGLGNLSWQAGGGGGNGTPGGSNTQVQFNNNGVFGASPYFTFNNYTNTVQIGGNLIANSFQMGAGVYEWSTSQVYFASTSSTAKQTLYSIPVANISGAEFHIIATDTSSSTRQSSKISSVVYQSTVQYTEYAGLYINGGVGIFEVDYDAGNIITPPSLQLLVTPDSNSLTVYKMLITVFSG